MLNFPTRQIPSGLSVQAVTPRRVARRPSHDWHVRHRPWQLQPIMIAPVLAGETLENLLMQSRCVSDPIKNPLIGWWLEYYFYFVPVRYLSSYMGDNVQVGAPGGATRSVVELMLLDQSQPLDAATYGQSASVPKLMQYDANAEAQPQAAWLQWCVDAVADYHFRDEGDAPAKVDSLPLVQLQGKDWTDSLYAADEISDAVDPATAATVGELEGMYQTYLALKATTLTEMTFEDYIATFGVKQSKGNSLAPELVMYRKAWSYPSNTVGTSGDDLGVPSAAMSWSVSERADKKRLFKEPGFIVGFTVARPKVYVKAQRTYAATLLADAFSWLPAQFAQNVETSIKAIAAGEGPLGGAGFRAAKGYIFDIRDLFLYGDHFLNFAQTETDAGIIAGPHATDATNAASKYPASGDLDLLFKAASPANQVRQDGVCDLTIQGTQVDHT